MALIPGTKFGPYEIIGPLGAGGMGEVYRARDSRLGRDVAIKVLPQDVSASPEDRARFRREAKTISSLNHPHICVLYDIGQEGDTDYLVMELVAGETLAQRIARGPLPPADVVKIGAQIADALDRAHRAGVVHRDLKPGNVMLTKSGAKLMDFGLALSAGRPARGAGDVTVTALRGASKSDEPITAKGMIIGTYQYMAPEQLEGKRVDARADIWALGCVLYEMATGKRAFEGSTPASLISAIMRDQPREMAELAPLTPPAFDGLVKMCLAKDPDDRMQTAHDVKLQLQWIADAGSKAGLAAPIATRRRNRERIAWGVAGSLLLLGITALFALWHARQDKAPRFTFTPLTYKPMAIFKAAFAPDGKTVVFSGATEGNTPRIFVIRPEYPEPQPVSEPSTHLLAISSRGELAVLTKARYMSRRRFEGTLARVPLGGGAPREILDGVVEADWSSDGSALAIIRGARLEFPIGKVLYKGSGPLSDMRFSPRGDRIAFLEHPPDEDGGSVCTVDLQGRKMTLSRGYWTVDGLAWSRDGDEILFSACDKGSQLSVYRVSNTGARRVVLESPGGQTIQDVSREGRWLVTRDEVKTAVMVHRPGWEDDRDQSWLDLSTNGKLSSDASVLVFYEQGQAAGDAGALCLRKTEGSPVTRLGEGFDFGLSPDGKWVLTCSLSSPQVLSVQPTGTGEPKRLNRGSIEGYRYAWWFPGGDSLLILGWEHGRGMRHFVQGLSGGPPRALTQEGSTDGATIARDGSWVMARSLDGPVLLYRFDGSKPHVVPWLAPNDGLTPWDVDGRSVLVNSGFAVNLPVRVYKVDLVTGRRTLFVEIGPKNRVGLLGVYLTDFSADYKSYAYDSRWMRSSLFLVEPEAHPTDDLAANAQTSTLK